MKKADMRRMFLVWVVASGLVLSWSVLCSGDFYVIPVKSGGQCTGDAEIGDVLVGKTFSNSTATGLTGTRAHAPVEKTGQTTSYATGDDGDLQKGVAWPSPRFTANVDNNGDGDCVDFDEICDGTVTDNLTGLIWLKDGDCASFFQDDTTGHNYRDWNDALTAANSLAAGYCGLTDGSSAGDWRLPNVKELQSLIDFANYYPALPSGHPFTGTQLNFYWSGSTCVNSPGSVWDVHFGFGYVNWSDKSYTYNYVRCVRGGP